MDEGHRGVHTTAVPVDNVTRNKQETLASFPLKDIFRHEGLNV